MYFKSVLKLKKKKRKIKNQKSRWFLTRSLRRSAGPVAIQFYHVVFHHAQRVRGVVVDHADAVEDEPQFVGPQSQQLVVIIFHDGHGGKEPELDVSAVCPNAELGLHQQADALDVRGSGAAFPRGRRAASRLGG